MVRRIPRRAALGVIGGLGAGAVLAACGDGGSEASSPPSTRRSRATTTTRASGSSGSGSELFDDAATCSVTPEQTEGPFYFDVEKVRGDITEDRDGAPLRLALRVRDAGACVPIADAVVDVWHSDADGVYSGFESGEGETFLRGAQITDADGIVGFRTVYPGAYRGRTIHIHAKVHLDNSTALTTQLYFDDDVSDSVLASAPYRGAAGRTRNADDGIFDQATMLTLTPEGDGFLGLMTFDVRS